MKHRVAVTGMGVVSPLGSSVDEFRDALLAGRSGVRTITVFDPASLPTRIAAEVQWNDVGRGFSPPPPWERATERGGLKPRPTFEPILRDRKVTFAIAAARSAFADSTRNGTHQQGEGGLSLGLGLELFSMPDLAAKRRGEPHSLQTPSDVAVPLIMKDLGLTAPPMTHVSACAAGTDAIGHAFRMIAGGRRRWMAAGGTDSMINPLGVAGFCSIGATTTANDPPARASRPFDRRRSGFVLGEGAGMLILERFEDAEARGATIHAEICGYGNSFDAHGISEPHPDGRGALQAMSRALAEAEIDASEVDCINAHGTSTPKNDPVETLAIRRLLGARAERVPVCAPKSMIGHLISAAGAVEAIAAIACMNAGFVHPTINLDEPDPACDLDYVPHVARKHAQHVVLSNSFGFGGQNASIVLRNVHA